MDNEKTLKQYLQPVGIKTWVGVILIVAGVALIILGLAARNFVDKTTKPKAFNYFTSSGEYCYFDVYGISEWVLEYTRSGSTYRYYIVEDNMGNMAIAKMFPSTADKMTKQIEWWNREDMNEAAPDPVRITGVALKFSTDGLQKELADVLDVSDEELTDYFGLCYLDTNRTAGTPIFGLAILGIIMCVVGLVLLFNSIMINITGFKKSMDILKDCNLLSEAVDELNSPSNEVIGTKKYPIILSEHFIYCKKSSTVIPYREITSAYKQISSYRLNVFRTALKVSTNSYMAFVGANASNANDKNGEIDYVLNRIAGKNPSASIGYVPFGGFKKK